jgi:hypothetical protein
VSHSLPWHAVRNNVRNQHKKENLIKYTYLMYISCSYKNITSFLGWCETLEIYHFIHIHELLISVCQFSFATTYSYAIAQGHDINHKKSYITKRNNYSNITISDILMWPTSNICGSEKLVLSTSILFLNPAELGSSSVMDTSVISFRRALKAYSVRACSAVTVS